MLANFLVLNTLSQVDHPAGVVGGSLGPGLFACFPCYFRCCNGLISILLQKYMAEDAYFVVWIKIGESRILTKECCC